MKNSSPYAKDKLVHKTCAKGLGNMRHHHSATVDREDNLLHLFDFLFTFLCYSVSRSFLEVFIKWLGGAA